MTWLSRPSRWRWALGVASLVQFSTPTAPASTSPGSTEPARDPRGSPVGWQGGYLRRQRGGRGVLRDPKARVGAQPALRRAQRGTACDRCLHPLLQHRAPALADRLRAARRLRASLRSARHGSRVIQTVKQMGERPIYSRHVVGWMLARAEHASLTAALLDETVTKHGVVACQLTIHSDRGSPMIATPVAHPLADLGVIRSHSRSHTSNDNPYSESRFKTMKYRPDYPRHGASVATRTPEPGASPLPSVPPPSVPPRAPALGDRLPHPS